MAQIRADAEAEFRRRCRAEGLKLTPQRLAVYRVLAAAREHPDVETIHQRVRRTMPDVSLDTVYRILDRFEELGLTERVEGVPGRARYDGRRERHHHFVCRRCGAIQDFAYPELDGLKAPAAARALGRIESVRMQIRGLCRHCAQAAEVKDPPA